MTFNCGKARVTAMIRRPSHFLAFGVDKEMVTPQLPCVIETKAPKGTRAILAMLLHTKPTIPSMCKGLSATASFLALVSYQHLIALIAHLLMPLLAYLNNQYGACCRH